jgi:CheY-like chemotaxis protein
MNGGRRQFDVVLTDVIMPLMDGILLLLLLLSFTRCINQSIKLNK